MRQRRADPRRCLREHSATVMPGCSDSRSGSTFDAMPGMRRAASLARRNRQSDHHIVGAARGDEEDRRSRADDAGKADAAARGQRPQRFLRRCEAGLTFPQELGDRSAAGR